MSDPLPQDRLTRLEAVVETLASNVDRLVSSEGKRESRLNDIISRQGKPDWSMLGVLVVGGLALAGFFFWGPIGNLEKNDEAMQKSVDRQSDRLQYLIEKEAARNNDLEFKMGGVMKINELFMAGKLKLD